MGFNLTTQTFCMFQATAEPDRYLWQGGGRGQVDIVLSWELSHYWTWRTHTVMSGPCVACSIH